MLVMKLMLEVILFLKLFLHKLSLKKYSDFSYCLKDNKIYNDHFKNTTKKI